MNLRRLKNDEFDRAERLALRSGVPLDKCPTCGSTPESVDEGTFGREPGTYRHLGRDHDCDCATQLALRRHYLVANIGDQYARLDWSDYPDGDVRESVDLYLDKWESARAIGTGIEFSSPGLGVGKTFGATHIGKELVKRGERVYFVEFLDVVSALVGKHEDTQLINHQLRNSTVLILDEVAESASAPQSDLFAAKLEEVVRHRTNFNMVTIMTTNLTPEKLRKIYPRVYSLLEAKQIRIELTGDDARQGVVAEKNLREFLDGEVAPFT